MFETLTYSDVLLEAIFIGLVLVDWGQTLNIADNPQRYHEYNPILGRHPSRGEVNTYFALAIPLHTVVTYALPQKWRKYWLVGTIVPQAVCVGNNFAIGLRVSY